LKIKRFFEDQASFSNLLEDVPDRLSERDRDDLTKTLALALHKEVSDLVSATSYRSHSLEEIKPDPDKILFESVDVVRYAIAIMNAWNISPENFESAWRSKDNYLSLSKKIEKRSWSGQPVAIVDMDDVLCEFRLCFSRWLRERYNVITDVNSEEYYFINALESAGVNPEEVFSNFILDDGFLSLEPVKGSIEFMKFLGDSGYFVHILTARPGDNLRCFYNTFEWLSKHNVYFDKVDFASEKLRWCMQSEYWTQGGIEFAVDDSPKHVSEYAKHGVKVLSPRKSYNKEVFSLDLVSVYDTLESAISLVK
jgi:hypothetical protein